MVDALSQSQFSFVGVYRSVNIEKSHDSVSVKFEEVHTILSVSVPLHAPTTTLPPFNGMHLFGDARN